MKVNQISQEQLLLNKSHKIQIEQVKITLKKLFVSF